MKFSNTILSLCFTAAATALPQRSTLAERMETRLARMVERSEGMEERSARMEERSQRIDDSLLRIPHGYAPIGTANVSIPTRPPPNSTAKAIPNIQGTATSTATNNNTQWAGIYLTATGSKTFNRVSGNFVIPTPKAPTTGAGTWYGTAWVGIDGVSDNGVLLQTGVDWGIQVADDGSESMGFWGWYEWAPAAWTDWDLDVWAGDTIELLVQATSTSTGLVTLTDTYLGQTVSEVMEAPNNSSYLTGKTAEWIVEDFLDGGSTVPFADFGEVTFWDCAASYGTLGSTAAASTAAATSIISSLATISASTATIANLLYDLGTGVVTKTTYVGSNVTVVYL